MRLLEEHKTNQANDQLAVLVVDEPGAGGASTAYEISHPDWARVMGVLFQNGPIAEAGVNGLTHEVLLAIIADRLRSFQAGPFACEENGNALVRVEQALYQLKSRTLKRMARGVEGTHAL